MAGPDPKPTFDPFTPAEMAQRLEAGGVAKAQLDAGRTLALAVLAGAFIGLGGMISTLATTHSTLGFGPTRLLAGITFSLGLILVVVGGAELFTGNTLIVMAWAEGRVSLIRLLRNWALVYAGNFVGAALTAGGLVLAGFPDLDGGAVGQAALASATAKVGLGFGAAFFKGVFCNALVCLAVWLCFSARSTLDKVVCIVFPITAFVAAGFEHSVANMYALPLGWLIQGPEGAITGASILRNLVPVTLGNVMGGSMMVGLAYWFIYLRKTT